MKDKFFSGILVCFLCIGCSISGSQSSDNDGTANSGGTKTKPSSATVTSGSDTTAKLLAKIDGNTEYPSYETLLKDLESKCSQPRQNLADMAVAYQTEFKKRGQNLKVFAILSGLYDRVGGGSSQQDCKNELIQMGT